MFNIRILKCLNYFYATLLYYFSYMKSVEKHIKIEIKIKDDWKDKKDIYLTNKLIEEHFVLEWKII